jgi:hypothetical protein
VLDESHSIKSSATSQTKSTLKLTATHKWAMSGTPWCTTPLDIIPQLQFIGLVGNMFARLLSFLHGVCPIAVVFARGLPDCCRFCMGFARSLSPLHDRVGRLLLPCTE